MCSYAFRLFLQITWPLEKEKSRQQNNEQHERLAQLTSTDDVDTTQHTLEQKGSPSLYIFQRLPSIAAYSRRRG